MNFLTLAVVSGEDIIQSLLLFIVIAVVFGLFFYLVDYLDFKEPFAKVVKTVLMLGAVVFLVNFLMSLAGHPLIKW